MNIGLMILLDRYVGALCLLFLYPIIKLLDLLRSSKINSNEVKTILVQKYFGIGSIVNLIPTTVALRRHYPNAHIIFAVFSEQQSVVRISDIADEVIVIESGRLGSFLWSSFRALFRYWHLKVDVCLDFEFFSKYSMLVSCLSLARVRVGYHAHFLLRSHFLTHGVPFNHYKHISRVFLAQPEILGADIDINEHELTLLSHLKAKRKEIVDIFGTDDLSHIVLINTNASELCIERAWPDINFAKLIDRITRDFPEYTIAVTGTISEVMQVDHVLDMMTEDREKVLNLAGKTDLKTFLAILESVSILISSDSGPPHLAAGYKTPSVILFGPETPVLYAPLNPRAHMIYKGMYCSPCLRVLDNKNFDYCDHVNCMKQITVDEVYALSAKILRKNANDVELFASTDDYATN